MTGLAAAGFALAGLVGCSGSGGPPPPCPTIVVVNDAARQVKFHGTGRDLTDVLFEARIEGSGITCEYDDGVIEVDMLVRLEAVRGPADREQRADLTYFVAIARSDQLIVAREEFRSAIALPGNQTRAAIVEEVAPRIPLGANENGSNYRIFLGLALSEDELEYNRNNR